MKEVDSEVLHEARKRIQGFVDDDRFEQYSRVLTSLQDICSAHDITLIFVEAPLLMEDVPGAGTVRKAIAEQQSEYLNLSDAMLDPSYYFDHIHLNRKGIEVFFRDVFIPSLN